MALLYRVVRQKYADRPLDTRGSWLNGGRWNPPGARLLYTAEHPALALVEILVHMPQVSYTDLPTYRLFTLEIPDSSRRVLPAEELPPYWNENGYTKSQTILANWLTNPDILAIGVPSSVMPDGVNYLLHGEHESYKHIRIVDEKALVIDPRFWGKA